MSAERTPEPLTAADVLLAASPWLLDACMDALMFVRDLPQGAAPPVLIEKLERAIQQVEFPRRPR